MKDCSGHFTSSSAARVVSVVMLAVFFIASLQTSCGLIIWPLGDSITDGFQVPGGYRTKLYEDLTNANISFAFVGSQTDNPSAVLSAAGQINHEGHSGYRTDQIYNNLKGNDGSSGNNGGYWINGGNGTGRSAISPDIVLLHIGTNDRTQGETPQTMYYKLVLLLHDLKTYLPDAKVFVASLIPRTDNATYETDQQTYNTMIPALVASIGTNFHFVDMHSVVTPVEVAGGNSGVHPNQAGYDAMGDAWFNAIQTQQGQIAENDQSNVGDNSTDANNSTFYFASGQTTNPAAALTANLLTGSVVTGNAPDAGKLPGINDLSPGTGANGSGTTYGSVSNMAYYGNGTFGNSLLVSSVTNTIALGGNNPNSGGYTFGEILVFSGWTDHASFNDQHYTINVSLDGTHFTPIYSVNYMPFLAADDLTNTGDQDASSLVTLTNLNANGLASGIKFVQFVYSAGLDAQGNPQAGQLIQEIEVFGIATYTNAPPTFPSSPGEFDQSNIGDNNSDTANSQFYFTSGQSLNTSAALQSNLLTGSTVVSSTGGADVGTASAVNDLKAQAGTGAIAYYGNTLFGNSLNSGNATTHGVVTLTIPLGGASPNAYGYTLGRLSVFSGWTDHASFCDQHYSLSVSRDGTNFLYLNSVNYMPFQAANDLAGNQSSSTLVTLTNLNVKGLAAGIKYIRFILSAGMDVNAQQQEGQLLQEIELFGTPTAGPSQIVETDQSNIGDNGSDANNSTFYFTSGQTINPDAVLTNNLLTGSTVVSSAGGVDQGTVAGVNDLIAGVNGNGSGTVNGSLANDSYFANPLFATIGNGVINPSNSMTHGAVTLTIPLAGINPSTNGYNLSSISVFEGWTDHASFNDQHYIIATSADGTNYTYLYSVNYMPFLAANDVNPAGAQDASTLITLSNLNTVGAKYIQFTLSAGTDSNGQLQHGQLIQEIEVFGTPTVSVASPPVMTTAQISGGSLVFSGTNGVAGAGFYVLTSTNVATSLADWTLLSTNVFDGHGNFTVTNSISSNASQQFYLLKMQ